MRRKRRRFRRCPVEVLQPRAMLDANPLVAIQATNATTQEGSSTPGQIVVSRTGDDLSTAIDVGIAIDGTASSADYNGISLPVHFNAYETEKTISITALDERLFEENETLHFTLQSGSGYDVDVDNDDATITITDAGNTAPLLTPASANAQLATIGEDSQAPYISGTLVRDLFPTSGASDAEGDSLGLAIVGSDTSHGTWEYSLDGSTWSNLGTRSDSSALLLRRDDYTKLRFIPSADFNGDTATVTYRLWDRTDGQANGSIVTIGSTGGSTPFSADNDTANVTVTPVNDAPTLNAGDYYVTTDEDVPVTFNVFSSAAPFDVDGDSLYVSGVTGSATFDSYGNITYTPGANFNGSEAIQITVSDGQGGSATATLHITVNSVNDAPVATGGSYEIWVHHSAVSYTGALGGGSATDVEDGSVWNITYPTSLSFAYGYPTSFDFTATDSGGLSTSGTVALTVRVYDNVVPTAANYSATTNEETPFSFNPLTTYNPQTGGSLAVDGDNDALTVSIVPGYYYGEQTKGTASVDSSGNITYTPNVDAVGTDTFRYQVADAYGGYAEAVVSVSINNVNDAPVATVGGSYTISVHHSVTTYSGALGGGGGTDVDGDNVTVSYPSTISVSPGSSMPVTFYVSDGQVTSEGTIWLTVNVDPNVAPTASDLTIDVTEDTPYTFSPLASTSDADGDGLTVTSVSGSAVLNYDGTITYTPAANFHGTDSFQYTVSDGFGGSATATVYVTINAINDAPTLVPYVSDPTLPTIEEDVPSTSNTGTLVRDLLAAAGYAADLDGDALGLAVIGADAANGAWEYSLDGGASWTNLGSPSDYSAVVLYADDYTRLRFAPNANYHGTAAITHRLWDRTGGYANGAAGATAYINGGSTPFSTDSDTASITINSVSDAPTLVPSASDPTLPAIDEDVSSVSNTGTLVRDLLVASGYAADGDGDALGLAIIGAAVTNGTWEYSLDGGASWTNLGTPSDSSAVLLHADDYTRLRFVPNANFNGSATITYRLWDRTGGYANGAVGAPAYTNGGSTPFSADSDTAAITVNSINDAPTLGDGLLTTDEDTAVSFAPSGSDIDNDTLSYSVVGAPAHGSAWSDGATIYYSPTADYYGADSFAIQVSDGHGGTVTATVNVTINSVNDAPVAGVGGTYTISVNHNATSYSGPLGGGGATDVEDGSVSNISYPTSIAVTPGVPASFDFTAIDSSGASVTGTIALTVNVDPNVAPIASDIYVSTDEDLPLIFNPLSYVSDSDGDTLTVTSVSGSALLNPDGTVTYTPAPNFHGTDSFQYTVSDGFGGSATATVYVTINSMNDAPALAPSASNPTLPTIDEDVASGSNAGTLVRDLIGAWGYAADADGDALGLAITGAETSYGIWEYSIDGGSSWTNMSTPSDSSAVVLHADDYTRLRFVPNANYHGSATITHSLWDRTGYVNGATGVPAYMNGGTYPFSADSDSVSITVNSVNDAPTTSDQSLSVAEDTPLTVTPSGSDVDGDTPTYSIYSGPAYGTLEAVSGSYVYTPTANYHGADSFTIRVDDGHGGTADAVISIAVNSVNDAPVASTDGTYTISVNHNATSYSGPLGGGSATDVEDGGVSNITYPTSISVTPGMPTSFSFTATDSGGLTATGTISLTVNVDPNVDPVAVNDSIDVGEDTPYTFNPLTNDSDSDGDALTVTSVSGSAILNPDGTITYTPAANFYGADSFQYTVSDGHGGFATATVSVNVLPVNDAPVAVDGTYTISVNHNATSYTGPLGGGSATDVEDGGNVTITYPTSISLPQMGNTTSFTFTATDTEGNSSTGEVFVTIFINSNSAPVSQSQSITMDEDNGITFFPNVTDADGDHLTITLDGMYASSQWASVNSDGSISFNPEANFNGTVMIAYQASDGIWGGWTNGYVYVTVTPVNDAPTLDWTVAAPEFSPIAEDVPDSANPGTRVVDLISATGYASDGDGDPLAIAVNGLGWTGSSNGYWQYTIDDGANWQELIPPGGTSAILLYADELTRIRFVPATDFNGMASINYLIAERTAANGAAVVAQWNAPTSRYSQYSGGAVIVVTPVNDAPTVQGPAQVELYEHETYTFGPASGSLIQVADIEGYWNSVEVTLSVEHGTISVDGTTFSRTLTLRNPTTAINSLLDNLTYRPFSDFTGTDELTVKVDDWDGYDHTGALTAQHTVTITVAPVVAGNDTYSVAEDGTLTVDAEHGLLANDTQVSGRTVRLKSSTTHGELTLNEADGSFEYIPNADFYGTDTFTYRLVRNNRTVDEGTVTITVSPVNDPPQILGPGTWAAPKNGSVTLEAFSFDDKESADSAVMHVTAYAEHGTLNLPSLSIPGVEVFGGGTSGWHQFDLRGARSLLNALFQTITYTPDAGYDSDTLELAAIDNAGMGAATSREIDVEILPQLTITDAPSGNEGGADITITLTLPASAQPVTFDWKFVDGTAKRGIDYTSAGYSGTITFSPGQTSKTITLKPLADDFRDPSEALAFVISNVHGAFVAQKSTTISIVDTTPNRAPTAVDRPDFLVDENDDLKVTAAKGVLNGVTDPDGDTMTAQVVATTTHGQLDFNPDGSFTYTPDQYFHGTDQFTFKLWDGTSFSEVRTATITVNRIGTQPDYALEIYEGQTLSYDPSGWLPSGYALVDGPAHGELTTLVDGSVEYTPEADFFGSDRIVYRYVDGTGVPTFTVVGITITSVNDIPSFEKGHDVIVAWDAGPVELKHWATKLSRGAYNENGQTLSFQVTTDNDALFATGSEPLVTADGTLKFELAAGVTSGTATVTVQLIDNGGTAAGGVDRADPVTFTIEVVVPGTPGGGGPTTPPTPPTPPSPGVELPPHGVSIVLPGEQIVKRNGSKAIEGIQVGGDFPASTEFAAKVTAIVGKVEAPGYGSNAELMITGTLQEIARALEGLRYKAKKDFSGYDVIAIQIVTTTVSADGLQSPGMNALIEIKVKPRIEASEYSLTYSIEPDPNPNQSLRGEGAHGTIKGQVHYNGPTVELDEDPFEGLNVELELDKPEGGTQMVTLELDADGKFDYHYSFDDDDPTGTDGDDFDFTLTVKGIKPPLPDEDDSAPADDWEEPKEEGTIHAVNNPPSVDLDSLPIPSGQPDDFEDDEAAYQAEWTYSSRDFAWYCPDDPNLHQSPTYNYPNLPIYAYGEIGDITSVLNSVQFVDSSADSIDESSREITDSGSQSNVTVVAYNGASITGTRYWGTVTIEDDDNATASFSFEYIVLNPGYQTPYENHLSDAELNTKLSAYEDERGVSGDLQKTAHLDQNGKPKVLNVLEDVYGWIENRETWTATLYCREKTPQQYADGVGVDPNWWFDIFVGFSELEIKVGAVTTEDYILAENGDLTFLKDDSSVYSTPISFEVLRKSNSEHLGDGSVSVVQVSRSAVVSVLDALLIEKEDTDDEPEAGVGDYLPDSDKGKIRFTRSVMADDDLTKDEMAYARGSIDIEYRLVTTDPNSSTGAYVDSDNVSPVGSSGHIYSVTIGQGALFADVELKAISDSTRDRDENVQVLIVSINGVATDAATPSSDTLTVLDQQKPRVFGSNNVDTESTGVARDKALVGDTLVDLFDGRKTWQSPIYGQYIADFQYGYADQTTVSYLPNSEDDSTGTDRMIHATTDSWASGQNEEHGTLVHNQVGTGDITGWSNPNPTAATSQGGFFGYVDALAPVARLARLGDSSTFNGFMLMRRDGTSAWFSATGDGETEVRSGSLKTPSTSGADKYIREYSYKFTGLVAGAYYYIADDGSSGNDASGLYQADAEGNIELPNWSTNIRWADNTSTRPTYTLYKGLKFETPEGTFGEMKTSEDGEFKFVLELENGAKYEFDEHGLLKRETDRFGNQTKYDYDQGSGLSSYRLKKITYQAGETVKFEYDTTGAGEWSQNLRKITIPGDLELIVKKDEIYSPSPQKNVVIDGESTTKQGTDGTSSQMRVKIGGALLQVGVEASQRTEITDAVVGNFLSQISIGADKKAPNGKIGRLASGSSSSDDQPTATYVRAISAGDVAGIWKYQFDRYGLKTAMAAPQVEGQTAGGDVWKWDRDAETGQVVASYSPAAQGHTDGQGITLPSDGFFKTTYEYDSKHRLEYVYYVDGTSDHWTYDGDNRNHAEKYTDRTGRETRYVIDDAGNVLESRVDPSGLDLTTIRTYTEAGDDLIGGLIKTVLSAEGRLATYQYFTKSDGAAKSGRVKSITYTQSGSPGGTLIEEFDYDVNGFLAKHTNTDKVTTVYRNNRLGEVLESRIGGSVNLTTGEISGGILGGKMTYDSAGGTRSETTPKATGEAAYTTKYQYDNYNRLKSTTTPPAAGQHPAVKSTTVYAGDHSVKSSTDLIGGTTTIERDARDRQTKVVNAGTSNIIGRGTTSAYNGIMETEYEYDAADNLRSMTDALGRTTYFTYDKNGRLIRTESPDPDGAGNPLVPLVSRTEYDAAGRVLKQFTPNPAGTGEVYTRYYYDAAGRLVRVQQPQVSGHYLFTAYEYYRDGSLKTETIGVGTTEASSAGALYADGTYSGDVKQKIVTTAYDFFGRVQSTTISYQDPETPLRTESASTVWSFDGSNRLVRTDTDFGLHETVTTYDAYGRVWKVLSPAPSALGPDGQSLPKLLTVNNYYADGRLESTTQTYADASGDPASDPKNVVTSYTYDELGRPKTSTTEGVVTTKTVDLANRSDESRGADNTSTKTIVNTAGQVIRTEVYAKVDTATPELLSYTDYYYDQVGLLYKTVVEGRIETTYQYDDLDRRISSQVKYLGTTPSTEPEQTTVYTVSGQVDSVSDGNSTMSFVYDTLGRVLSQTDTQDSSSAQAPVSRTTQFVHDDIELTETTIDPNGNHTITVADGLGRIRSEEVKAASGTVQVGATATYQYDDDGNLAEYTDRTGKTFAYAYDALDRRISETWVGDAGGYSISYTYDKQGRLAAVIDPNVTYGYTYDDKGRLDTVTITGLSAEPITILHFYDQFDRIIGRTDSFGGEQAFGYDAQGRLDSAELLTGDRDLRVAWTYDALNRRDTVERREVGVANVLRTKFTYATNDQLGEIDHQLLDAAATTIISHPATFGYGYDAENRLESYTGPEGPRFYKYDDFDQLIGVYDHEEREPSDALQAYSYDAGGNRIQAGQVDDGTVVETPYSLEPAANNRLLNDGSYTYEYDDEGNRTKRTSHATDESEVYGWDRRNRQTSVTFLDSAGVRTKKIDYVYDSGDHLIKRTVYGATDATVVSEERYVYQGDTLLFVLDGAGALQTRQFVVGTQVLGQLRAGEDFEWLLTDRLGSTRALVETGGTVVASYDYDAYGILTTTSADSTLVRVHYAGYRYDADTKLYYTLHRWYDAAAGRWISEDPIGFEGGTTNLAEYVGNDPLNKIDPSGLADRGVFKTNCADHHVRAEANYDYSNLMDTWSRPVAAKPHVPQSRAATTPSSISQLTAADFKISAEAFVFAETRCSVCHNPHVISGGSIKELSRAKQLGAAMFLRCDVEDVDKGIAQFKQINSTMRTWTVNGPALLTGNPFVIAGVGGMGALKEFDSFGDIDRAVDRIPLFSLRHVPEDATTLWREPTNIDAWVRMESNILEAAVFSRSLSVNRVAQNGTDYSMSAVRERWWGGKTPVRPNPDFPRGREYMELSHTYISNNGPIGKYIPDAVKNRGWNLNPMWGSEHALADPHRYRFMRKTWKKANEIHSPAVRLWERMPTNHRVGVGVTIVGGTGYGVYELLDGDD